MKEGRADASSAQQAGKQTRLRGRSLWAAESSLDGMG